MIQFKCDRCGYNIEYPLDKFDVREDFYRLDFPADVYNIRQFEVFRTAEGKRLLCSKCRAAWVDYIQKMTETASVDFIHDKEDK